MKYLLILDTETTGLSALKHKIIEIAAIMFDIENKTILHQFSTLIKSDENPVEHINHISVKALQSTNGQVETFSLTLLSEMIINCDAIMAHNAAFDKAFVNEFCRFDINILAKNKKWICSKTDIAWPKTENLKLVTIAGAMGVNTVDAHRALGDCVMLAACLAKLPDLKHQLENLQSKNLYKANIGYEDKHLAKQAGFYFNSDMRRWEKKLTAHEASLINFSISKV